MMPFTNQLPKAMLRSVRGSTSLEIGVNNFKKD